MADTTEEYFTNALDFLIEYRWIYNFKITKFFSQKAWEFIPGSWVEPLVAAAPESLQKLPIGNYKDEWPESLKKFIVKSNEFSISHQPPDNGLEVSKHLRKGMGPKKLHEVGRLADVINTVCKMTSCHDVLDVGSGLGYLGLVLSEQLHYHVLGLESESSRSHSAHMRAEAALISNPENFESMPFFMTDDEEGYASLHKLLEQKSRAFKSRTTELSDVEEAAGAVGFHHLSTDTDRESSKDCQVESHNDTDQKCNSDPPLSEEVTESGAAVSHLGQLFETSQALSSWCMTGLHSCGDLTPTMLKAFIRTESVRALVCVSCCYHRMSLHPSGRYHHFPMSQKLRKLYASKTEEHRSWSIDTYALRLAAQETRARWQEQTEEDHDFHIRNVAFRGILDVGMECATGNKDDTCLQKNKRKIARRKHYSDFDTYTAAVLERTSGGGSDSVDKLISQVKSTYAEYEAYIKYVEPFTVAMQGVLENLILKDRLHFLHEHGFNAKLLQVFDDKISPRSMAILAWK